MDELNKVNSSELYIFGRNHAISLIVIAIVILLSKYLSTYLAPFISLFTASILYSYINYNRIKRKYLCLISPYTIFLCHLSFSAVLIICNLLYVLDVIHLEDEFLIINRPFVPILIFAPVALITTIIVYKRRKHLFICIDCKLENGDKYERGTIGKILNFESHLQLKNLIYLFAILTFITWVYYLFFYVDININERDRYVFVWLVLIAVAIDATYFIMRYYNLYLDLKERNEIIDSDETTNSLSKYYYRFYVICDNYIYINQINNNESPDKIDTPFLLKTHESDLSENEIHSKISELTGVDSGELRFFYERISTDNNKYSVSRYFYFLNGNIHDYTELATPGQWIDYNKIKKIYSLSPSKLEEMFISDTTRVATILITEKIYDKNGNRKSKIKNYLPSFNLLDIRQSNLNFQDDTWIRISLFNADSKFFRIKRWMKSLVSKN